MRKYCLGFVLLLVNVAIVQANDYFPQMSITGSQVRLIQSEKVNQEYQLLIKLPDGYEQSEKNYPVIYFLDAQWDFPLMVSTYAQSHYDGFIPDAILVGIQWGGDNPEPDVLRERDFTPSHMGEVYNSGGAGNFLQFIKQELIPFIGDEYRTNKNRVLMGSSYGGLFTLYTLFNEPDLFNGYIPTSSASDWDNKLLFSYAKSFADKKLTRPIKLYSAIGEFDDLMPAFNDLSTFFEEQNFKGVSFKFERLSGLGHASLKSAGNTLGLHYVFAKPNLTLSTEQLVNFVGKYNGNTSNTSVNVLLEKGQLHVQTADNKHSLLASTRLDFYLQGELFQASFDSADKPQKLTISRFMHVKNFSRVDK